MKIRFLWRRRKDAPPTHDQAIKALKGLEHDKAKLNRYRSASNDGYNTPYNSAANPGARY